MANLETKEDEAILKRCRAIAAEYERLRSKVQAGTIRSDAPEWRQIGDELCSAVRRHGIFKAGPWIYSWSWAEKSMRRLPVKPQRHADRRGSDTREYGGRLVKAPKGIQVPDQDWLMHESPLEIAV